jgi:hypothetical protein
MIVQLLGEVKVEEQALGKRLNRLHRMTKRRPSAGVVTSLAKLDTKLNQLEQMLDALAPATQLASAA